MWEQLEEYRPAHHYNCGAVQPLLDHLQSECVLIFHMGLNEQFVHVRGQIILMDPMSSIDQVFALVLQDEK